MKVPVFPCLLLVFEGLLWRYDSRKWESRIVYYSQNDRQQSEWQIFWASALGPSPQQQQIVALQLQASATVISQFGYYWPSLVTNQRPWHPGLAGWPWNSSKFFRQWAPVFPGSLGRFALGYLNVVLSVSALLISLTLSGISINSSFIILPSIQ